MVYSAITFKEKLGLVSLVALASLVCPQEGFSMEPECNEEKVTNYQKNQQQNSDGNVHHHHGPGNRG